MKANLNVLIAAGASLRIPGFAQISTQEFTKVAEGRWYFDAGKWLGKVYFNADQEIEFNADGEFRLEFIYRNKPSTRTVELWPMLRDKGQTIDEWVLIALGQFQLLPWLAEDEDPWKNFFAKIKQAPTDTRSIDELMFTAD